MFSAGLNLSKCVEITSFTWNLGGENCFNKIPLELETEKTTSNVHGTYKQFFNAWHGVWTLFKNRNSMRLISHLWVAMFCFCLMIQRWGSSHAGEIMWATMGIITCHDLFSLLIISRSQIFRILQGDSK